MYKCIARCVTTKGDTINTEQIVRINYTDQNHVHLGIKEWNYLALLSYEQFKLCFEKI